MEEQLDILNEKGEKTGETRNRQDAHLLGLLHRSVHVWFLNKEGQLLLQKRLKNMLACPRYWEISASGHVSAGQSSIEGAQRETEEELGVSLPQSSFNFLFTIEQHYVLNEGTYINNEFADVYLVHLDLNISEFKIDSFEVEEIRWLDTKEFKKWIKEGKELLTPHNGEYEMLLEYLSKNN